MQILKTISDARALLKSWRDDGNSIALAPTMGYYHKGHEKLMRTAAELADKTVVSLFVNPTQFAPNEDFAAYPRDLERDAKIAEACGVDLLFAPEPGEIYATDHQTWVEVPEMSQGLCGASRPAHFRGVCTIVLKLFMITRPNIAVFGEKDWQQQAVIKRMVKDLNLPVKIVTAPTQREADGLALSSRNAYLDEIERSQAPHFYRGMLAALKRFQQGERDVNLLKQEALAYWSKNLPDGRLDYISIVDPDTLEQLSRLENKALLACAIRLGKTRLIDNILLEIK